MSLQGFTLLAQLKMHEHGLHDWTFHWDKRVGRLGCCLFRQKRISMSAPLALANSDEEAVDTLMHEIAHALVGKADHGPERREAAKKLGATPEACAPHVNPVLGKWVLQCPKCSRCWRKHRKPRVPLFCRGCGCRLQVIPPGSGDPK